MYLLDSPRPTVGSYYSIGIDRTHNANGWYAAHKNHVILYGDPYTYVAFFKENYKSEILGQLTHFCRFAP